MRPWVLILVLIATPAFANEKGLSGDLRNAKRRAKQMYDEATLAYNLGEFERAIEGFRRAYELQPAPEFLFNMAQAYRQLDDCEKAVFFYKRFLSLKPDFPQRAEVEGRITDLERRCEERKKVKDRPPEGTQPAPNLSPPIEGASRPTRTATIAKPVLAEAVPKLRVLTATASEVRRSSVAFRADVQVGLAFQSFGDLDIPMGASARAGGSVALQLSESLALEPGLVASWSRIPFHYVHGEVVSFGALTTLSFLANLALRYSVGARFEAAAEVGAGGVAMIGLDKRNQFTRDTEPAQGPIVLPAVRIGLAGSFDLTPQVALTIVPLAISVSPANEELREGVGSLVRIEAFMGARYAF